MGKHFKFDTCKTCTSTADKSRMCNKCDGSNHYNELWQCDPNCEHNIVTASGGGIKCTKCGGWFCY